MSPLRRLAWFLLGLLIVSAALATLLYISAPLPRQSDRAQPAATLFQPPP